MQYADSRPSNRIEPLCGSGGKVDLYREAGMPGKDRGCASGIFFWGDKDWLGSSPRKVLTLMAAIPGWMLAGYIRHKVRQL